MGRTQKRALTREAIVGGAVALADRAGLEGFTIRKLAEELGTAPMTIYYHVPSKDQLIDAMVETVFSQIERPGTDEAWTTAVRRRCVSARAVLNRHPWAAPLMESRRSPGVELLGHHEAMVACLRTAGFSVARAAHAYAVLDSYVYGYAFQEANLPGDERSAFEPIVTGVADRLASGGFPYLAELTREHILTPEYRFGASFAIGLDLILDGLERLRRSEGEQTAAQPR